MFRHFVFLHLLSFNLSLNYKTCNFNTVMTDTFEPSGPAGPISPRSPLKTHKKINLKFCLTHIIFNSKQKAEQTQVCVGSGFQCEVILQFTVLLELLWFSFHFFAPCSLQFPPLFSSTHLCLIYNQLTCFNSVII